MNEVIKEILDFKENADYKKLSCDEIKVLRDYITNLQQENERLKQPKIFIDTQDMEERYGEELYKDYLEKQVKDYKTRMDKAVEELELWQPKIESLKLEKEYLLDILNGDKNE